LLGFGAPAGLCSAHPHAAKSQKSSRAAGITSLTVAPSSIALRGPRDQAIALVLAHLPNGQIEDVTSRASWSASAPVVRRFGEALVPVKDGSAIVAFSYEGRKAAARVTVTGAHAAEPISFANEIIPALTRAGCNQGACHGSQFGKAGFKLSLAGFDPYLDYTDIVKQARGRRINIADPTRSLILLKPTMSVPHGGGRRLVLGSPDYNLIVQWLKEGAPGPHHKDAVVTGVEVTPAERVMAARGDSQQLEVRAQYSDGVTRDVTNEALISSLNDSVASCTPDGLVKATGPGQTAIMVRYMGQAAVSTVLLRYPRSGNAASLAAASHATGASATIDALVARKQTELGLSPSCLCSDRTFIRRVSFDLIGTAPTPEQISQFVANRSPDKRAKLIDSLLDRPSYADFWTLKWGDLLRSNRASLGVKGMWSFTNWIHGQFAKNRPIDKFVKDMILSEGSGFTNGPANFYRVATNPQDLAETTSQVFLGVRLQCARCHHHPYEKWSQDDYYRFAAFFARVGVKGSNDFGIFGNDQIVRINDNGEVNNPATGAVMPPTPLGVRLASYTGTTAPSPDADGDRRITLANWLVSPDNRLFARNIANRYWGYMFGKGIVNPIDDERVTNPPSNPELLDFLADQLVKSGFDLKHLLRIICNSETYQRSSRATLQNCRDDTFFTHYLPKRLPAETLLDAIDSACGTREQFPDLPLGTRAIQLPDPAVSSDFLDMFGRPQRLIACECERGSDTNLSQTLRLMNGDLVNRKVAQSGGRVTRDVAKGEPDGAIIDDLYEASLGRPARPRERNIILGLVAFSPHRKHVYEDVLLTLLNSKEFLFNH
ncbi:MAG TPA: DUF1549 domain-containing protein, partial [Chthonomonadales bacterium]|nr:DUF1549 domain-containing protein [Chthonomonadales bacterium]